MKKYIFILLLIVILGGGYITSRYFTIKPVRQNGELDFIQLPQGFHIEVFADNLGGSGVSKPGPGKGARMMKFIGDTVYVAVPGEGTIIALDDMSEDGIVEQRKVFISGLNNPHNLDYYDGWYYIAAEDGIFRVQELNGDGIAEIDTLEKVVDLPTGGHWTRTVKVINKKMYISIGSSCNVCNEDDARRATIQECSLEGKNCRTFVKGLRNAVDFIEKNGVMYATENGRDLLGNNIPPDEINIIQGGKNYGWPICYGDKIHDTDFDTNVYIQNPCNDTEAPLVNLESHVAPLGLAFYEGEDFPEEYKGKLFVAYHGSWNKQPPTGYKLVVVDVSTKEVENFATGWLMSTYVSGRPVGIVNFRGGLLVSDDVAGKMYYIYYGDRKTPPSNN